MDVTLEDGLLVDASILLHCIWCKVVPEPKDLRVEGAFVRLWSH